MMRKTSAQERWCSYVGKHENRRSYICFTIQIATVTGLCDGLACEHRAVYTAEWRITKLLTLCAAYRFTSTVARPTFLVSPSRVCPWHQNHPREASLDVGTSSTAFQRVSLDIPSTQARGMYHWHPLWQGAKKLQLLTSCGE